MESIAIFFSRAAVLLMMCGKKKIRRGKEKKRIQKFVDSGDSLSIDTTRIDTTSHILCELFWVEVRARRKMIGKRDGDKNNWRGAMERMDYERNIWINFKSFEIKFESFHQNAWYFFLHDHKKFILNIIQK